MAIDIGKLEEFLGRFTADLVATVAAGTVVIGHRLSLYQAVAAGPAAGGPTARPDRLDHPQRPVCARLNPWHVRAVPMREGTTRCAMMCWSPTW